MSVGNNSALSLLLNPKEKNPRLNALFAEKGVDIEKLVELMAEIAPQVIPKEDLPEAITVLEKTVRDRDIDKNGFLDQAELSFKTPEDQKELDTNKDGHITPIEMLADPSFKDIDPEILKKFKKIPKGEFIETEAPMAPNIEDARKPGLKGLEGANP